MFQRDLIVELFTGPGLTASHRRLLATESVRVRQMACRTRATCSDPRCATAPAGVLSIGELAEQQVECREYAVTRHPLLDTSGPDAFPKDITDAVLDLLDSLADLKRFARLSSSPAMPSSPMWHVMAARAAAVHARAVAQFAPRTTAQIAEYATAVVRDIYDSPEFVAAWLDQVALSSRVYAYDSGATWQTLVEELLRHSHVAGRRADARLTLGPLWREAENHSPWAWVEFPDDVVWAEYPPVGLSPVHEPRFPRIGIVPAEMRFTYSPLVLEVFASRAAALDEWEQFGGAEAVSRVVSLCGDSPADFPTMRAALLASVDHPADGLSPAHT